MRMKKIYITLLIILFVFFLVMFCLFGIDNIRQENYSSILIVGDDTVWTYKNKKWLNITHATTLHNYNWKDYIVYENNELKGTYKLWHDDKWYVFDDEKKAIQMEGTLLAYDANFKLKVKEFSISDVTDMTYVRAVLDEKGFSQSTKFTVLYKVDFDYDGDGKDEDFYVMSNTFPIDFEPDYIFSIVFMVKNNEIYYIYDDVAKNTGYNGCKPYFNSFLDTNNDGSYEFILSCGRFGDASQVDMLYQFDKEKDKFKILISNQ